MALKNRLHACLTLAISVIGLVSSTPAQSVAVPEAGPALLQPLWERAPSEFVRQWQFAVSTEGDGPVKTRPAWISQRTWSDTADVADALSFPASKLDGSQALTALARAEIKRDGDGPAVLLLGVDGDFDVLVNGKSVSQSHANKSFAPDRNAIPVTLKSGSNEIILRLTNHGGPWRLALRVAEQDDALGQLAPFAADLRAGDDSLAISTEGRFDHGSSLNVRCEAFSPDGSVVATAQFELGKSFTFSTTNWPDGPYEIRCTTTDGWQKEHSYYFPWYKGDALATARDLMAQSAKAEAGPSGDHLRMLADLVKDRLGGNLDHAGPSAWQSIHSALFEYRELLASSKHLAAAHPSGFVRLAYTDEVDGSTQFCRAYLPKHYSAEKRWPLVVVLHGFNPANPPYIHWWSVDLRHNDNAESQDVIVIEPLGRGNAQYQGFGEHDVLRALDEAKRAFQVDDDRVYLLGESMGGHGTWSVGSRNPDVFAAIAPYFGGWDFRMAPVPARGWAGAQPTNAYEQFAEESASSFASAQNLLHVPVYVSHGDADPTVSVEFTRHIVAQLNRWGYPVRYEERPGMVHEDLRTRAKVIDWLLTHRRKTAPKNIRLHAYDLAAAHTNWLSVDQAQRAATAIEVDAEFLEPGILRLDTANAAVVTLTLPESLAPKEKLSVIWNGVRQSVRLANGTTTLSQPNYVASSLRKLRGLEGPISNIISTPFIIVVGTTSPNASMRALCEMKAKTLVERWQTWQHTMPRLRHDTDLSDEEKRRFSLILIGGPDANSVARALQEKLPFQIDHDGIAVDGRRWTTKHSVLSAIFPNPYSPEHYVLYVASTSTKGLALWNPVLWAEPFGFGNVTCDWYIKDSRSISVPPGHLNATSYLAYGFFDPAWRRQDATTFARDQAGSESSPANSPESLNSSESLSNENNTVSPEFAGTYQLFPGVAFKISNTPGFVLFEGPGGTSAHLVKESDSDFLVLENGSRLHFSRGASPEAVEAVLNTDGQELKIHRVSGL